MGQDIGDELEQTLPLSSNQKIPTMTCEDCGVSIKCENLSEAEQRARIHVKEIPSHKTSWEYQ